MRILLLALLLTACAQPGTVAVPQSSTDAGRAARAVAPGGALRAAINFGNPILATKDAATGAPRGLSVDGQRFVAAFVEEMKASGFVADALRRHRVEGVVIAPAAGR